MSIAEKLTTVAENMPKVYKAGQSSMVDESKIIEKTVSGAFISVYDVSEIPHNVGIQLTSDTVTDFTSIKVRSSGKNLIDVPDGTTGATIDITDKCPKGIEICLSAFLTRSVDTARVRINYVVDGTTKYFYGTTATNNTSYAVGTIPFEATSVSITMQKLSATESTFSYKNVQLELGSTATEYEPYNEQTLTPNADGTVEGMTSLSPYMNVFTDNADVNISMTYRKSWGMQEEYDRFWDSFQNSSSAGATSSAQFAGRGWNINTFKPKYDIKVTSGFYLFYYNGVAGDLVEILNELGVSLDTSKMTSAHNLFANSQFTRIGEIDFGNLKSADTAQAFASPSLVTIDKLIVKEESTVLHSSTFTNATGLKNIAIEGTLAGSVSFQVCPLSKDSILSVFNSLSDTITGKTLTLKLSAVNAAFETSAGAADGSTSEEWAALIATKTNWTISLV